MESMPLNLSPGSDLRESIEEAGREQGKSGFVVGVIGNLSRACFQCPGRPNPTILDGNLEIITLNGTFSHDGVVHLHLSLSDGNCQVWGGHLERGTRVLKGAEVLLYFLDVAESSAHSEFASKSEVPPRIEIAVIKGCPWSSRAVRLLSSNEIRHSIKSINNDDDFHALKKRTGLSTFPQVFIDGVLLGGYESLAELKANGKLKELA